MQNNSIIIELHYLPCIEYFGYLSKYKTVFIEKHEHYVKQSYRNRCSIRGANKIEDLIVPVKHKGKQLITDIEIDYHQKWLGTHTRAIMSAYGKAPFYEYFNEEFLNILRKRHKWLFDLNLELLTICLKLLRMEFEIKFTDDFDKLPKNDQIDVRGLIHPKRKDYEQTNYISFEYSQVFGNNFVGNLSVIDLLFCTGSQSLDIVKNTIR